MNEAPEWRGRVTLIPTQAFADERGELVPVEFSEYGFRAVRAFTVTAPSGSVRGGHGHVAGRQILVRLSGEIEVEVRHAGRSGRFRLDSDQRAALIEPSVWARQTYLGESPAMLVLCDTPYRPDDYVRDDHLSDEGAGP